MGQISVTILEKNFRMACADGEEEHLEKLAKELDNRLMSLKKEFGEIGEQRLVIMTSLILLDEIHEISDKYNNAEKTIGAKYQAEIDEEKKSQKLLLKMIDNFDSTAEKIDKLSDGINHVFANKSVDNKDVNLDN